MRLDEFGIDSEGRDDIERRELFIRLLQQAYHAIYGSVLVLVPNRTDADDAMQEACVTMWREFDKFEPGTNFRRWACSISYNIARSYRRKELRHRYPLKLPDADLRRLAQVREATNELLELRRELLQKCLSKLGGHDKLLIKQCYGTQRSMVEAARLLGMSEDTIYARLSRVRKKLYHCINASMRHADE